MNPYSVDFRHKILETHAKTQASIKQTAERFGVSDSFVRKLLKQHQETGLIIAKPHRGGPLAKLTPAHMPLIEALLEDDNDATLEQLCRQVEDKTGIRVSVPTMCRVLQKLELNLKKKTIHAMEAATERVQGLRTQYWASIKKIQLKDLVFIDETGVNLAMTRHYARAKNGKRAYGKRPYNRGRNVTLIGAISVNCFLASFTFEGWTDKNTFLTYVKSVLVPKLWSGACVIMDNLPAHKATEVREAIESVGARVEYLSPYSPDFNPIENCWSKIKEFLRSCESRTYTELDQSISEAIKLVSKKDLVGWFTHCCYYHSLT